jgi:drug/metabolite transporter (DMT)-like permease
VTTSPKDTDRLLKSIYYLIGGVFVFSLQDIIIKWISGNYPVHEIVLIRSLFAVFPLLLIAHLEGGLHVLRTSHFKAQVIRSALMFGSYICFYLSLAALPLAETVSLFFSGPIFITILSVFFLDEKIEFSSWVAVLVGFLGVVIMLKPGSQMADPASLMALLAALLYAIGSIITRKLGKTDSGISLAFYPTVMYIVFSATLSIALSRMSATDQSHPSVAFLLHEWQLPSQGDFLLLLAIGLIAATGFYFLSQAYRLGSPAAIAPFEYISVPLGVLGGYIFWKDVLGLQSIIGMVLIVGSGLYIFGSKKFLTNKYVLSVFKIKIRK